MSREDGCLHLDASLEVEGVDEAEQSVGVFVEDVDELVGAVVFLEGFEFDFCLGRGFGLFFYFLAEDGEGGLVDEVVVEEFEEVEVADDVSHHHEEVFLGELRLP